MPSRLRGARSRHRAIERDHHGMTALRKDSTGGFLVALCIALLLWGLVFGFSSAIGILVVLLVLSATGFFLNR